MMSLLWHWLSYVVLLGLAYGVYGFYGMSVLVLPIWILLLLPVFSFFGGLGVHRKTSLTFASLQPDGKSGKVSSVCLFWKNSSVLPGGPQRLKLEARHLYLEEQPLSVELEMALMAGKTEEVEMPIRVDLCGMVQVEMVSLCTRDWLGLWQWKRPLQEKTAMVFYPPSLPIEAKTLPAHFRADVLREEGEARARSPHRGDWKGIREYMPGDSLSHVHWKLSARLGKNMVRTYDTQGADRQQLSVDLDPGSRSSQGEYLQLEPLFQALDIVGHWLLLQEGGFSLHWTTSEGIQVEAVENDADWERCYRQLLCLPPAKHENRREQPEAAGWLLSTRAAQSAEVFGEFPGAVFLYRL